jgi:hypothetical protein
MCITGVCKKLLDSFSEEDASEYVALLKEHARFRDRCRKELVAKVSQPAPGCENGSSRVVPISAADRWDGQEAERRDSADPAVDEVPDRSSDEGRR